MDEFGDRTSLEPRPWVWNAADPCAAWSFATDACSLLRDHDPHGHHGAIAPHHASAVC